MSNLGPFFREVEGGKVAFWCEGCKQRHFIQIGNGPSPRWSFDGNLDSPTISPSIRVWDGGDGKIYTCHSFIRGGKIQYLNDCTHELKGQTVPLTPLPKDDEL
jgi:hypothetical protein